MPKENISLKQPFTKKLVQRNLQKKEEIALGIISQNLRSSDISVRGMMTLGAVSHGVRVRALQNISFWREKIIEELTGELPIQYLKKKSWYSNHNTNESDNAHNFYFRTKQTWLREYTKLQTQKRALDNSSNRDDQYYEDKRSYYKALLTLLTWVISNDLQAYYHQLNASPSNLQLEDDLDIVQDTFKQDPPILQHALAYLCQQKQKTGPHSFTSIKSWEIFPKLFEAMLDCHHKDMILQILMSLHHDFSEFNNWHKKVKPLLLQELLEKLFTKAIAQKIQALDDEILAMIIKKIDEDNLKQRSRVVGMLDNAVFMHIPVFVVLVFHRLAGDPNKFERIFGHTSAQLKELLLYFLENTSEIHPLLPNYQSWIAMLKNQLHPTEQQNQNPNKLFSSTKSKNDKGSDTLVDKTNTDDAYDDTDNEENSSSSASNP